MHALASAFATAVEWKDAADTGANASTYQPELSSTELIAELHALFATQRRAEWLICRYLADLVDRIAQRRDAVLGAYADELHAARSFFGLGVRETRERVRVGRALRTLPRIEQAFVEGELSYSRVREVTRVASAPTELGWLELAQTLDMRALERRVAGAWAVQPAADRAGTDVAGHAPNDVAIACGERAGEPVTTHWLSPKKVRVTFELSAEAWALVEQAMEGARRAAGAGSNDGQALEAVARDALSSQTHGSDASNPRGALVLDEGQSCSGSALETSVDLHATQGGISISGGSLPPASRLLEVMGGRGGWTMDALTESSGLLARDVAALLTFLELDGTVRRRHGAFDPV